MSNHPAEVPTPEPAATPPEATAALPEGGRPADAQPGEGQPDGGPGPADTSAGSAAEGEGGGDEGRRGRRRPRSDKPAAVRADGAVRALAGLVREVLRNEGVEPQRMPMAMELSLKVPLRDEAVPDAAAHLVQQLRDRVRNQNLVEGALVPGHAYCFFCDTALCEHARPQGLREVFDGYASTGRPRFVDFVSLAIERREPGIEQLLSGSRRIVAFVTRGDALRTQQLAEFGKTSPVYNVVGQVTAGLYDMGGDHRRGALSFQAVLVRTPEGVVRLKAHYVCAVDIMEHAEHTLFRIFQQFRKDLEQEAARLTGRERNGQAPTPDETREHVMPLLRATARDLVHENRGKERRTQHAQERSEERQRPTDTAYPDATRAHDQDILIDTADGTIVVVGARNRAHVFTPDARHVTSLRMDGRNLKQRVRIGRWRPAEPAERGTFRELLHLKAGEHARRAPPAPQSPPAPPAVAGSAGSAAAPASSDASPPAPAGG